MAGARLSRFRRSSISVLVGDWRSRAENRLGLKKKTSLYYSPPLTSHVQLYTRSRRLHGNGHALAAAKAERRKALLRARPLHLVEQSDEHARARSANWMADRDGAARDIHLRGIKPKLLDNAERLRGKRLVRLNKLDIR